MRAQIWPIWEPKYPRPVAGLAVEGAKVRVCRNYRHVTADSQRPPSDSDTGSAGRPARPRHPSQLGAAAPGRDELRPVGRGNGLQAGLFHRCIEYRPGPPSACLSGGQGPGWDAQDGRFPCGNDRQHADRGEGSAQCAHVT